MHRLPTNITATIRFVRLNNNLDIVRWSIVRQTIIAAKSASVAVVDLPIHEFTRKGNGTVNLRLLLHLLVSRAGVFGALDPAGH